MEVLNNILFFEIHNLLKTYIKKNEDIEVVKEDKSQC